MQQVFKEQLIYRLLIETPSQITELDVAQQLKAYHWDCRDKELSTKPVDEHVLQVEILISQNSVKVDGHWSRKQ